INLLRATALSLIIIQIIRFCSNNCQGSNCNKLKACYNHACEWGNAMSAKWVWGLFTHRSLSQNSVSFETGFRKSVINAAFSFKSKEAVPKLKFWDSLCLSQCKLPKDPVAL
ncbi:MAG: hypothetical protein FWC97_07480, partial [Treponema sp.]|nr:hypothetical protein [Treponema sp.]